MFSKDFQGFQITVIFPRSHRSGPGPDGALAGLGRKKYKDFQRFPIGFLRIPVPPAGGLCRLAVRASVAKAGNAFSKDS